MDQNSSNITTFAMRFLNLIRRSERGKFKLYIGMVAGVGKTYRMLQDAHELKHNGVDVWVGYVETHQRPETVRMLEGLPQIPRKTIFYKGKEVEEMDLEAVLLKRPELVIVDELAHTNVEGSRNSKRWQDVMQLLDAGINVLSALNIQHIESLKEDVRHITGVEVSERVPDSVLQMADEVVNIDLTADELVQRLKDGNIYPLDKVPTALNHFFRTENILQLRELALKEVAFVVERKVETEVSPVGIPTRREKIVVCISSAEHSPRRIIRRAYRLASRYNTSFVVLYVQTPREAPDSIDLASQRHLIDHFRLATELGGLVEKVESRSVTTAILEACRRHNAMMLCMGQPAFRLPQSIWAIPKYRRFLRGLKQQGIDLLITG